MCMSKGMLVAGYSSGLIRFFHLGTRKKVVEIAAHARGINAMTISPDNLLATTSDDGAVQVSVLRKGCGPRETAHLIIVL